MSDVNNPIEVLEVIAAISILVGTIFSFFSAVGLIRLPDLYSRAHAASKSSTMGVLFTLVGTFLFFIMEGTFSIRLFLGIFFVFLTAPVAAHVIVRSAYRSKVPLAPQSVQDDLKGVIEIEGEREREQ
ncbi:monovalent cation/H(+) antiporter subunit G [Fredinandcohnia sp. QZ13]|uniref:monovalent cation/H(+) antiporter subunit G n=1 Tax=Fredinandcohnia sp. QZ13 TaxID=3073144 RepID=UPI0028535D14|nr:monovalent cation/H(+) antiporter subunit G [Fredinandcohnia sp. QZ13]MDR4887686.1 monovalent cation/H(+) antiporter subunit G [Fredinandcohnia sp. QZ13]